MMMMLHLQCVVTESANNIDKDNVVRKTASLHPHVLADSELTVCPASEQDVITATVYIYSVYVI